jgi:hypothetical protein
MPLLKGSHFLSFAVGRRLENPTLNATMSGNRRYICGRENGRVAGFEGLMRGLLGGRCS